MPAKNFFFVEPQKPKLAYEPVKQIANKASKVSKASKANSLLASNANYYIQCHSTIAI